MKKKSMNWMAVVFLSMVIFALAQPSHSATVVTVEPGGTFVDIANFQFSILDPPGTTVSSFTASLPADWLNLSTGSVVNAFSGGSSLPSGPVGTFNIDVLLGGWVFGNQQAVSFVEGVDYIVSLIGTNYTVSAVPIPAAAWLLGSGLVGLVVLKRRRKS